jgi:uncharacterized protein (TIGR04222 family)
MNIFNWHGPEFLVLYFTLLIIAVVAAVLLRLRLRGPGDALRAEQIPPDLHPLEVAYLVGGSKAVTDSAIAMLVQRGSLAVQGNKLVASSLAPQDVTPLEDAVYRAVAKKKTVAKVGPVRKSVKDLTRSAISRLQQLGLVPTDEQAASARKIPALLLVALLALGVAKIAVGIDRNRPVEVLVFLCAITFVFAVLFLVIRPRRTGRGALLLERLKERHAALRTTARSAAGSAQLTPADATLAFALFGPAIFAAGPMHDLNRALQPPSSGGTGCGSASSCGSGSCGGGGGGCGGCGGGD